MEKKLRCGKLVGKKWDDVKENPPGSICPEKETGSRAPSLRSARSAVSTASKKTLLQARARIELAELELQQARIANEKVLIEASLSEEMATLDGDNDDVTAASDNGEGDRASEIQQWVDRTTRISHQVEAADTTTRPHQDDSITLLAHAITDALKKTSSATPAGDKLIGRLSAKELPTFSGDALEWMRFKNAFVTTAKIGQYTDEENVARLQRCLVGEAWEAVAARLITATSAEDIMRTLEIRFGRPDLVLHKLISDVKKLPKLTGARAELVVLATKVSNCVAAIEAMRNKDYLYSPELTSEIMSKLTEPLVYRWIDYWAAEGDDQPRLFSLSKYLMREAERVCKAGVMEPPQKNVRITQSVLRRSVLSTSEKPSVNVATENARVKSSSGNCIYCDRTDHTFDKCPVFLKLDVNKRWDSVCEKKLCFKCLSPSHRRDRCRGKKICVTCKRRGHHSLLHRDDWEKLEDDEKPSQSTTQPETAANLWNNQMKRVFLKVLPVIVEGPAGCLQTFALLDEGSTVSLIEHHVAASIGVEGPFTDLNLRGAVGDSISAPSQSVTLIIKTLEGVHRLERVRTVDKLTLPTQSLDTTELSSMPHLADIPLQTFKGKPTMIIGQDYWYLIVSREVREGRKNEPVASFTRLGWVLHGFASSSSRQMVEHNFHMSDDFMDKQDDLHDLVKSHFRLESIGIKHEGGLRNSSEERRALEILKTKSRKIGERWEAGLLWRSDDIELPDNRRQATSRLKIIEKNMDADPNFAADYEKQVVNMLEKGYAEEVTEPITGKRVWFLPHFGVRNPNKPGKLRLVFDAKAKCQGVSLNTELLSGPDLLNSLIGVLLRFRERAVAVTGDIREMFLQVKIIEEDQNAQCFLWRGMDRANPPKTFKMTSMTFGATSSPCTATYILRRNAEEFLTSHPRAVEAIRKRHYVDDYLDSTDTEVEMRRLVSDVAEIHKAGGFEIRGWASNRSNVLPQQPDLPTVSLIQTDRESDVEARTLGLIWKSKSDILGFDVSLKKVDKDVAQGLRRPTKREMLRVIMSVFDPLGFLCPILIRGKILLQDIWRSGIQWDQEIGDKAADVWFRWLHEIKKCQNFSIPRCYGFRTLDDLQLHVFVDASEQAYASVVYLRREGEVRFVAGKSRVAPLKPSTIPRLELQAALMGTRLGTAISKEHDVHITKRYFWTDSQTVWWWIHGNSKKKMPFVSHRLSEIDELTRPEEWRWLPGRLNAADGATRAEGNLETSSSRWITGPDFLNSDEDNWPSVVPQAVQCEEDKDHIAAVTVELGLVNYARFSNWRRMLRSVAFAIVFTERCKRLPSHLTPEHERRAENAILCQVQAESFPEELQALQDSRNISTSSRLRQINPCLDSEGLLRVKGRIVAVTDLPRDFKEPIILDGGHPIIRMLLVYEHRKLGHHSMETLLNDIRQRYYVLRLRQTVRSIIAHCIICKKRRGRCEQPVMAGLPPARLHHHCRPFSYSGLDLFGPMMVTIGRRNEKRWGVLFTCLSTRAVSIEIAASLSADSTILAIRRMAARRGLPKQIYSDNGTNFTAADKELRTAARSILNDERLILGTSNLGIEWRFNPADAASMGGSWEILVRSIKTALYATLRTRAPREEVLSTLLAEAENIVNSRPLTHVTLDPNEEEALTPNHFLLGRSSALPSPGSFSDQDLNLRRQWRIAQRLTDHFWARWIREYLPSLHQRKKWTQAGGRNVSIGDIVLIADSSSPRNVWPRGRVTATTPGRDGRVRIVDVTTRGGVLRRPASKVVVLLRAEDLLPASTADAASQRGGDCG